jgi:REP element-mobilizing transposase RayT
VGRATLFKKAGDYAACEKILQQGHERLQVRLLAFVDMPNHSHLVAKTKEKQRLPCRNWGGQDARTFQGVHSQKVLTAAR